MELVVEQGPDQGARLPVAQSRVTIGRGSQCTFVLHDDRISQCHVEIRRQDDAWIVSDQGSSNGTWVNRKRLREPYRLRPGDQLGIGRTIISFSLVSDRGKDMVPTPYQEGQPVLFGETAALSHEENVAAYPFVLDVGVALGSLLLVISAWLDWFSYTLEVIFVSHTTNIHGMSTVIGRGALTSGLIGFVLAVSGLTLRFLAQKKPALKQSTEIYLRWVPWIEMSIGIVVVLLTAIHAIFYSRGIQTELLFGIGLEDLVTFSIETGGVVAGIGLILFLATAGAKIVIMALHHQKH